MSTCSPISTKLARSLRNGGSTTTPTDRTRASTGSHRPSLQPAPTGAKPRTDSTYKRGQIGEQVRCHALEFQHAHVRGNPDYSLFCARFPETLKQDVHP